MTSSANTPCPNCGYCPVCGQAKQTWPNSYPPWPQVWCGDPGFNNVSGGASTTPNLGINQNQ